MEKEIIPFAEWGKLIKSTPIDKGRIERSLICYLSGIPEIDEYSKEINFYKNEIQFVIVLFNNVIDFALVQNNNPVFEKVFWREQIIDFKSYHGVDLNINEFPQISGSMLEGIAAMGVLGSVVAAGIDKITSSKPPKKDKFIKGSKFDIIIKTNSGTNTISFCTTDKYIEYVEAFLKKIFEPKIVEDNKTEENKECYIATLCYGDIDAKQVQAFRYYRDNVLINHFFGKLFILIYYKVSPKLANHLKNSYKINKLIKIFILDKIYKCILVKYVNKNELK